MKSHKNLTKDHGKVEISKRESQLSGKASLKGHLLVWEEGSSFLFHFEGLLAWNNKDPSLSLSSNKDYTLYQVHSPDKNLD